MLRIITIVGARPQFIKAATISRITGTTQGIKEILVHTDQHYDDNLSRIFFEELEIPQPDYHLGIGSGTHGFQTGRMLEEIEQVLLKEKPQWVLVYGDTNSTLAGALAAVKLHIPVAHVEAGLRSFNRRMPEEINRVLTDHASDLLFAPTQTAVNNLHREGISENKIRLVGDVMYDAALYYGAKAEKESRILEQLGLESKGYILCTIHRAENTDNPARLRTIFEGLVSVARDIPFILPLHPRTRTVLQQEDLLGEVSRFVRFMEPVGYLDMVLLEKQARVIVTDSGGVQKEAFFYRVPCITLREETEWVELVNLGWNQLVPPVSAQLIAESIKTVLTSPRELPYPVGLYGDGKAAGLIISELLKAS
ncbi:MAG TPA: UDP-N-acetylglucosamine 2-epimerase (non-hydrolyzing) [Candidatus Limnocylindrales bacterium]|nr:UDP-N-acetylglucosamine 2-epimerase (non-hydrolyzing) [Candidatus Limnocylindrales bacterium]